MGRKGRERGVGRRDGETEVEWKMVARKQGGREEKRTYNDGSKERVEAPLFRRIPS